MTHRGMTRVLGALILGAAGLVAGCGGSSSTADNGPESRSITIPFQAVAGSYELRCGDSIPGLGVHADNVTLADFRLFVHDVKLVTGSGDEVEVALDASRPAQNEHVVLLDFRNTVGCDGAEDADANPGFNDVIAGSVRIPEGAEVTAVRFTLGVPFELNHIDQANAVEPLRNPGLASGMAWNWQSGYKFTGWDVFPNGGVSRPGNESWSNSKWNVHLGSRGCPTTVVDLQAGQEPAVCDDPNRIVVTLDLDGYELDDVAVRIDYAALVENADLTQDVSGPSGCMSARDDVECRVIFERLGLPFTPSGFPEDQNSDPVVAEDNGAVVNGVFSIVYVPGELL